MRLGKHVERWVAGAVIGAISIYHFLASLHRTRAFGFVDFPIFLRNARDFLETGELYPYADLSAYAPAAAVYKFPPLYALLLLPWARSPEPANVLLGHWWLQVVLYVTTVAAFLYVLRPRRSTIGFVAVGIVAALNFEPFFETLWRLQVETLLLLLVPLCFLLDRKGRPAGAGAALSFAGLLKVYPAVLVVYFAVRRRWMALAWTALGGILILAASVIVIGLPENLEYFFGILPHLMRETPSADVENLGVGRFLRTVLALDPMTAKRMVQLGFLGLTAVSATIVYRAPATGSRSIEALRFSWFVPLMLIGLPNSWANYQLLLLWPVLALLAHAWDHPEDRSRVLWLTAFAWITLLFYAPCSDSTSAFVYSWPCAQTPPWLGLVPLPRGVHDAMVDLRALAPLALWSAILLVLVRRQSDGIEGKRKRAAASASSLS